MKKISLLILGILITIVIYLIIAYPNMEFYKNGYLYMMSYSKDWDSSEDLEEFEQETCYDESYSYNKKRNISIQSWDYRGFLFFKWFKVKYKEGNICETEYLLEEAYINRFLEEAVIKDNEKNINVGELIRGKKSIIGNIRYPWNENNKYIRYILDGKYMDMFIWINEEGLIIIQVGLVDEGPKYIAYK